MSELENMQSKIAMLEEEITSLKQQLDFEHSKHKEWKSLASMFHDTLWKMIDKYVMVDKN